MIKWYQALLTRRPLATQIGTTAILFGAGDFAAQHAVERRSVVHQHDYARSARMICYGGAVFGPAATLWYKFLQARVNLSSKAKTVVARVVADQLVFTPVNLFVFLSSMAILEGPVGKTRASSSSSSSSSDRSKDKSATSKVETQTQGAVQRAKDRLDAAFVTGITKNWLVWPWVQLANFSVVPLEHRVLVVNVVALGWNCYLSYLNSGGGGGGSSKVEQE